MDNKNNINPDNKNDKLDSLPSNQLNSIQNNPHSLGDDGKQKHFGGKNTDFDRNTRRMDNPMADKPEGSSFNLNKFKEAPNHGKEALKNLLNNNKDNKSKIERPDENKKNNPLDNIKDKMASNPLNNLMPNRNNGGGNASQNSPEEKDISEKSGSEILSDGIKNAASSASSLAKTVKSAESAAGPASFLFKGKLSLIIKLIPVIAIIALFFGILLVGGVLGSITGEASVVSDVMDVDTYFSEDYYGDLSKIDNKHLKNILEDMESIKKDFTKDGKSFDHIMIMATINALIENDPKHKLTYKDFSKRDIKLRAETVSGKSDDQIKAGIDEYLVPKFLKDYELPDETEVEEQVEETTAPTTATTSKGYTIENKNGIYYINNIPVVNKTYDVPSSYNPGGLTAEFTSAFNKMKSDAAKQGINLEIISGYRSYDTQSSTYNGHVNRVGQGEADTISARPGHSEHQLGLAADLNSLSQSFGKTKEGIWLNNNMSKYGFILRYPSSKEGITGYSYEPWHIRYVGTDISSQLYKNGTWTTLEEYLGIDSSYNSKPAVASTNTQTKRKYSKVAEFAIEIRDTYYEFLGKTNACITGGSCNYSIAGFKSGNKSTSKNISVNNLKVRLMQSSRTGGKVGQPLPDTELVDFEKYVLGVAYAEVGCPDNENYFKTQLVAARSFALSRPDAMGNSQGLKLAEENGQWILQIRSSVDDQQYCDPDQGCSYKPCGSNIEKCQMWPGTSQGKVYKGPLTQDNKCRKWAQETIGEVLVDSNGYVMNTGYKQADQNVFKNSTNYKQTLLSHYKSSNTVNKADCNAGETSQCAYGVSTGDFANWTQKCEECRNVHLGNSGYTIYNAGCLATSVAMLIAKSGADTSIIVKNQGAFNNVTFVKELNKVGGFSGGNLQYGPITKIVPNFKYLGQHELPSSREEKIRVLQDQINKGLYVSIEVKKRCTGKTHFVALDSIQGDHIFIMDPATKETETWTSTSTWKANCASKYVVFQKT